MIQSSSLRKPAQRPGTVAVIVAVCLTVLMAALAFALDGGILFSERRHAQSVADAAALAAACDLYNNYWTNSGADPAPYSAALSACSTAAANGYAVGATPTSTSQAGTSLLLPMTTTIASTSESTVTVNIPPLSGDYVGKRGYVEVIVQYNEQRCFSNIFSSGTIQVQARAVAFGAAVAADVGILVLDPTSKGAFNANGNGTTNVQGTPIIVDSNNAEAAIGNGGGVLIAPEFDITGGYTTTGGAQFQGTINTGRAPTPDPLSDIPPPDPTTMTSYNGQHHYTQGSVTLSPGVYKGGISASGTASVTLQPGIYYMDGGGFSFSGQGNLLGNGVMIYNDPGNGNSANVNVSGTGNITLSGPTSGVYQGLTFFQNRTSTVSASISGGGAGSITGTFYFAGALLTVSGGGGMANIGSQYISYDLTLTGGGGINVDWTPYNVARKRAIYLVE
jgi:Flp pilus assembly protein TadG